MKTRYIFRVMVEVGPMEGTQLPNDSAGAVVNVYLGSNNIREAIDYAEEKLLSDYYKPVLTHQAYILDLENTDYDTDEEGCPNNEDLSNLQKNGGVWYGPFNLYPTEESNLQ